MNEQAKVFLSKMSGRIRNGEYDKYLNIPFATRELLYAAVKAKINKKIETSSTPLLTDTEIKIAIQDARETAAVTCELFNKIGITEKTDDGYIINEKWKALLKA